MSANESRTIEVSTAVPVPGGTIVGLEIKPGLRVKLRLHGVHRKGSKLRIFYKNGEAGESNSEDCIAMISTPEGSTVRIIGHLSAAA